MGPADPGTTLTADLAADAAPWSARPVGPDRAIVLIGFMGAGKSHAARDLALHLGGPVRDSDELIEGELGHSIAREFELAGEGAFREREERLVLGLLGRAAPGEVIALGGGSVLSKRVQEALAAHVTVLLEVDPVRAWERAGGAGRPLAREREAFEALYARRLPLYERLADGFIMPAPDPIAPRRPLGEAVAQALRALAGAPPGTSFVWARSAAAEYPVMIGPGVIERLSHPSGWPLDVSQGRSFRVTDRNVEQLFRGYPPWFQGSIAIAPGEESKTLESAERVWQGLLELGMTRADRVVAVGGGVVGDLAGFCAATYQRGVPVIHVPTTLVAQVDSAYGGKTGVDLPSAKNYVGAYHQPDAVLVDPDALDTLPPEEFAAGYAEVLKTALIAGGALWERVAAQEPIDERTILACARTKLAVVAADERDAGARQLLNLGHTVGHAIETATGYARYRHGEAVGLGLLAALRLSGCDELRQQVSELLLAGGLPVTLDAEADVELVIEAVGRDKKRLGEHVPFVLVRAPGDVRAGQEVSPGDLRAAVRELL